MHVHRPHPGIQLLQVDLFDSGSGDTCAVLDMVLSDGCIGRSSVVACTSPDSDRTGSDVVGQFCVGADVDVDVDVVEVEVEVEAVAVTVEESSSSLPASRICSSLNCPTLV